MSFYFFNSLFLFSLVWQVQSAIGALKAVVEQLDKDRKMRIQNIKEVKLSVYRPPNHQTTFHTHYLSIETLMTHYLI